MYLFVVLGCVILLILILMCICLLLIAIYHCPSTKRSLNRSSVHSRLPGVKINLLVLQPIEFQLPSTSHPRDCTWLVSSLVCVHAFTTVLLPPFVNTSSLRETRRRYSIFAIVSCMIFFCQSATLNETDWNLLCYESRTVVRN